MSSTTQNNDQKRRAVDYIQQIEDILQRNMQSRQDKTQYVIKMIESNRQYPGVCEELHKNRISEGSRVILPGKQNKNYNSIELIRKWPLIFVLQQLRNMFCHFHQCNERAQEEVGKNLSDKERKESLVNIFQAIFPCLDPSICLLEKSMSQLMHLFVK